MSTTHNHSEQSCPSVKKIKSDGIQFKLVIVGEEFDTEMSIFTESRNFFKDEIIHMGYCNSFEDYASWLWKADILPVTINQEFFGASVMEAVYCHCYPLLPRRLTYHELFNDQINFISPKTNSRIGFSLFGGNIIDTKLKHHKYEKEDYKKIFYLDYFYLLLPVSNI